MLPGSGNSAVKPNKTTPKYIIIKWLKVKGRERSLKVANEMKHMKIKKFL
jgi:uncharacterized Zn ribbon protein